MPRQVDAVYYCPVPEPRQNEASSGLLDRLKRRGVVRVALSYAVIAWLLLQIGDVVLDPFDFGDSAMRVLLVVVALGFPVALALAWFFELTPQGVERDRGSSDSPRPSVTGIRRYADILIIGVLVIAVAFLLARQGGLIEEDSGEPVVAVLPFDNMGPEAADTYFGEGLADTLIHKLGELGELVVLASQSTFQFKGRDLELGEVGAKLGATVIMLGSVQRAGEALRVNARLVEVESGKQLWSGSYDRRVQDVFAIQDEIAGSVTDALHLVLAPEARKRLATSSTTNLTAYDAYVLGISRLARRTLEDRQQAMEYFRQAIAADPNYALAYTGLVEALFLNSYRRSRTEPLSGLYREAVEASGRAIEIDPGLGEAWLARALTATIARDLMDRRELSDDDIIALYEKAIELSPSNAMAHKYFAMFFSNSPDISNERSQALYQTAARLDPRSGIIKLNVGQNYIEAGDLVRAEQWLRQSIATQEPYFRLGLMSMVGFHLWDTGRLDEAARWSRAWRGAGPDDGLGALFHHNALLNLGALEPARQLLDELATLADKNSGEVFNPARWGELNQGMRMARLEGNLETIASLARQMSTEYWEPRSEWPVLQDVGWHSPGMTSLALVEIGRGQAETALARFEAAYPGPFEAMESYDNDLLRPAVMMAALHKQVGNRAHAEQLLRDYLAFVRDPANDWRFRPRDWTEFTILAFLGDTDGALSNLESVVDSGYLYQWYALKDGAFDSEYAAVIADPRFEALYARITGRVDELRQAFLAEPELRDSPLR